MNAEKHLPNCKRLFQTSTCRDICLEVLEQYRYLFEDFGGIVVDVGEYPHPPYECEFVVKIYNGIQFRFEGDYGGWIWFIRLPFRNREGHTRWHTDLSLLNYMDNRLPGIEKRHVTQEMERKSIERIIQFYESDDFKRFENEYDIWNARYMEELEQRIYEDVERRMSGRNET